VSGPISKVTAGRRSTSGETSVVSRQDGRVVDMTRAEFEDAVRDALDEIPAELAAMMDNVVVLVEDEVPPGEEELLGLYEGTPLTERGEFWAAGSLPDRITIFRNPTLAICDDRDDVVEEVAVTVVHEIAHHFGIDDERLHELGWG
jgi:predicted Zn-dependent protease with MMP-like domain